MTQPSPTPQAVKRLRALGDRELLAFVNEVTSRTSRELMSVLPSVDGFRKDSAASLPKRKQALLHHFLKKGGAPKAKERADIAYYYLWRAWAEQHLKDVEGLAAMLDAIENATAKDHPQVVTDQPQAEIEALFGSLHEQSFLNHCAAETITRLLQFSPFETTDALERLVSSAKPLVAVERDRELSLLPKRMQGYEELLKSLQGDVERSSGEVARLAEAVTGLVARPAPVVAEGVLTRALETVLAELAAVRKELETHGEAVARISAAADGRLKAVERSVADLGALWSDTEDRAGKQTAELQQQLADITERVGQLGQNASPAPVQTDAPSVASTPSLRVVPLEQRPDPIKALATGTEAAALLTSNYVALGLKSPGAAVFAEEVLAAAVTGRVLFLKGSFSTELARATAMALAGNHVVRARVPVGSVDAATLDTDVVATLGKQDGMIGALVLERVNNAPFELLADAIADLVRDGSVLVVATLADGVSTFPEQPLYLQLGPVFDADVLDWSIFPKANATASAGALASLDPKALSMQLSKGKAQTEELLRLLRKDRSLRNPRIERTATAFMSTLEGFRTSNAPTSLQSTSYGWLSPLWRMTGLAPEDIEDELDGGRIDSEGHVDTRLQLLLDLAGIRRE
ncbi:MULTISPECIES: hypothetical protein [unclassified Mesorhizobium]|uniref:hypothetical protein n=1 Tax=unclassified Mesorhizobium TaxID=325217 RepID=UPI00112D47DB|nr:MULTISPECIES: hypothetical protein [unclassified Mesorhizobium]TPI51699.1 hypothetical protein FJW11_19430 [Mesorhizobium sp. B3-1-1]TPJ60525.1 hypothetical protein FJ462_28405 [Mesorhizobium sp. B2-6-7]TPJ77907.1 hypothetical protein FJ422_27905 [Mesorhizobium sp. B2-6-3]TPJ92551.1 hypothetical protein FJ491_29165 [Mesorhizobium sp. B2-5-10]TPK11074.1 hypothetical protein FJ490_13485 [Mesorhizobium sp. B2-5-11]